MDLVPVCERLSLLRHDYTHHVGEAWATDDVIPTRLLVAFFQKLDPEVRKIALHHPDGKRRVVWSKNGSTWHSNIKELTWP